MVVIACNTASAVALDPLARSVGAGAGDRGDRAWRTSRRRRHPQPAHRGDRHRRHGQGRGLPARHSGCSADDDGVVQRPCQVFVALAEEGWTDSRSRSPRPSSISARCSRARRRLTRSCSAAPISRCSPSHPQVHRRQRGDRRFGRDHGGGGRFDALDAKASAMSREGCAPVRFFATDSPDALPASAKSSSASPIDPKSVELVDLLAQ